MDLRSYNFPKVTMLDAAFSTLDTPPKLLEEARSRGFYNGSMKGNKLFSKWFFGGLEVTPAFKDGVDQLFAQKAMNYAVCLMRSFVPKHEYKEAVCAMIFEECLELE